MLDLPRAWPKIEQPSPHRELRHRYPAELLGGDGLARQRAGAESTHRLLALPGVSKRSRRLLGPLVGRVDDG